VYKHWSSCGQVGDVGHRAAEEARSARAAAWTKLGAMADCNVKFAKVIDGNRAGEPRG
jgi:hypothetical protein